MPMFYDFLGQTTSRPRELECCDRATSFRLANLWAFAYARIGWDSDSDDDGDDDDDSYITTVPINHLRHDAQSLVCNLPKNSTGPVQNRK